MTVNEKITDHTRFEPGTLALLAPRSTNRNEYFKQKIDRNWYPNPLFLSFLDEKMLEGRITTQDL